LNGLKCYDGGESCYYCCPASHHYYDATGATNATAYCYCLHNYYLYTHHVKEVDALNSTANYYLNWYIATIINERLLGVRVAELEPAKLDSIATKEGLPNDVTVLVVPVATAAAAKVMEDATTIK